MLNPKELQAKDIMSTDLLTLNEDTPVSEALATLEDYQISGAPVLSAGGDCVGVFTSTDVVKRDVTLEEGETPRSGEYFASDPFEEGLDYFSKEDYDDKVLGRDTVGQWMSTKVHSVAPFTPLESICRTMVDLRIHRLLVMKGQRLEGLISTLDVVRLLAGTARTRGKPEARKARAGGQLAGKDAKPASRKVASKSAKKVAKKKR